MNFQKELFTAILRQSTLVEKRQKAKMYERVMELPPPAQNRVMTLLWEAMVAEYEVIGAYINQQKTDAAAEVFRAKNDEFLRLQAEHEAAEQAKKEELELILTELNE